MTHDELLARIKEKGSADFATLRYNPDGQKDIQDVFKALRAVVELIDEHESDYYLGGLVERIREAIEKELG